MSWRLRMRHITRLGIIAIGAAFLSSASCAHATRANMTSRKASHDQPLMSAGAQRHGSDKKQGELAPNASPGDDRAWRIEQRFDSNHLERRLVEIFHSISANRLDEALGQVDRLLADYPNFRLGHLIKGDLLLARARPIEAFGAAPANAAKQNIHDLRDEALLRLRAFQNKPAPGAMPRYLLQMPAVQRYALVADARAARLYVFANDGGKPRYLVDYYFSHGKQGVGKAREGDQKTPIGIYRVVSHIPGQKLPDFYGRGALPLDFPNEIDRRLGRNGSGIWLHGTPPDTFSRPPRATDGCIVLSNPDIDALAKNLQIGTTPVIVTDGVEWLTPSDWLKERDALLAEIESWRKDWESLDGERYLRHYSTRFSSGNFDYDSWAAHKKKVNAGKNWIQISLENIGLYRYPGKDDLIVATFELDYRSSNFSEHVKKRQFWIKERGGWKIVFEGIDDLSPKPSRRPLVASDSTSDARRATLAGRHVQPLPLQHFSSSSGS